MPTSSLESAPLLASRRFAGTYVIDGSPEGYGAAAFGLPVVFGREALNDSAELDPTLRSEPYAGRRTFSVGG